MRQTQQTPCLAHGRESTHHACLCNQGQAARGWLVLGAESLPSCGSGCSASWPDRVLSLPVSAHSQLDKLNNVPASNPGCPCQPWPSKQMGTYWVSVPPMPVPPTARTRRIAEEERRSGHQHNAAQTGQAAENSKQAKGLAQKQPGEDRACAGRGGGGVFARRWAFGGGQVTK